MIKTLSMVEETDQRFPVFQPERRYQDFANHIKVCLFVFLKETSILAHSIAELLSIRVSLSHWGLYLRK